MESPLLMPCAPSHKPLWDSGSVLSSSHLNSSDGLHWFQDNLAPLPPKGSEVEFDTHSFTEIALLRTQAVAKSLDLMASQLHFAFVSKAWMLLAPQCTSGWVRSADSPRGWSQQVFPKSFLCVVSPPHPHTNCTCRRQRWIKAAPCPCFPSALDLICLQGFNCPPRPVFRSTTCSADLSLQFWPRVQLPLSLVTS